MQDKPLWNEDAIKPAGAPPGKPGPRPPDEGIPPILEWKLDWLIWELDEIRKTLERLIWTSIPVILELVLLTVLIVPGLPWLPPSIVTVTVVVPATDTPAKIIATDTPPALPVTPTPARPAPTATSTPTVTPTTAVAEILRGTVTERSNGRYCPAATCLYKYGLANGARIEIIGQDPGGGWYLIQAIGGHNPAWINAKLVQVDGDPSTLPVVDPDKILTVSGRYGPPKVTSVSNQGGHVVLQWAPVALSSDQQPPEGVSKYLVEIRSCNGQQMVYSAIGTNDTTAEFDVDTSCGQASVVLRVQFKEGVSAGQEIPLK